MQVFISTPASSSIILTLSLFLKYRNVCTSSALVIVFVINSFVPIRFTCNYSMSILFLIKCTSISTCFDPPWNTAFWDKDSTTLSSHQMVGTLFTLIFNSFSSEHIYIISAAPIDRALYSNLALDFAIKNYFFELQEMRLFPK